MPDPMAERFEKRREQRRLDDLAKKTRDKDDLTAEEELLKKTKKVEPIRAGKNPGRNDPCPCGSGKKFKNCCAGKT